MKKIIDEDLLWLFKLMVKRNISSIEVIFGDNDEYKLRVSSRSCITLLRESESGLVNPEQIEEIKNITKDRNILEISIKKDVQTSLNFDVFYGDTSFVTIGFGKELVSLQTV